eukprot:357141-Chlamydomonas_euryale.AAC.7
MSTSEAMGYRKDVGGGFTCVSTLVFPHAAACVRARHSHVITRAVAMKELSSCRTKRKLLRRSVVLDFQGRFIRFSLPRG